METNESLTTQPASNGVVAVEQQRAIAEVQGAIISAKRFPRDMLSAINRIKVACQRPTLAAQALYNYGKGGSSVTGPSIRLMEAIAQNYGNISCGVIELSRNAGSSECMAYAWDLETNFRDEKKFQVRHWRDTKSGGYALKDERDIYELIANMGARRKRACIMAVIPGDVVEDATEQCEATLKADVNITPDLLKKLVEAFAPYGVAQDMIEKRIQRNLDAITPAQVVDLRKIINSLKDGMSKPGDWFEMFVAAAVPSTVRLSAKQMKDAKYEVEVMGQATAETILEKNPNLPADQVEEVKKWEFKQVPA